MTEFDVDSEGQWGNGEGHEDYGEHTHDGDFGEGVKGGMTGYDEGTDANEHDERREEDSPSIGGEHRTMVLVLIERALCHEYGVVVSLAENEGCQDNVDQIKLDSHQGHDAQDPYPTDGHGQESEQGQLYVAEREPKEQEDNEGTGPTHIVEVVCEVAGQGMVHTFYVLFKESSPT